MLKLIKTRKNLELLSKVFKWHFKYYILGKPSPLIFVLYITTNCNFKCEMCNIWRKPSKHVFDTDKLKSILKEISKDCYYFSISGGEPLLVHGIFEILSYAKQYISYVHFVTNGYLIDEEVAKKLSKTKIDEISISIDGLEETHDKIRGVSGAYRRAINAIKLLKQHAPNIKIVVNTIIIKNNIDGLKELSKTIEDLKVYQKFQPVNEHPIFSEQKTKSKKFEFSDEDLIKIKSFLEYIKTKKHVINSPYFLSQIINYFNKNINKGIFNEKCILPDFYCEIFDSKLYPCLSAFNWENGYKIDKSLKDVFHSDSYREKVKQLRKCKLCKENMYVCYLEPRMSFPLSKFIKYQIIKYPQI